jgi:hypothetical protein
MAVYVYSTYRRSWDTVQLHTLLEWRLMVLGDLSFYFLIKNVVAVMLRFLEGGLKQNFLHKNWPPIFLHFRFPWN